MATQVTIPLDPTWLNPSAVSYVAGEVRVADAALAVRPGVTRTSDTSLAVTLSGDVATVQPGSAVLVNSGVSGEGIYRAGIASSIAIDLPARHATLSRIDVLILRVFKDDATNTAAANRGSLEWVSGTASSTPAPPAAGLFPSIYVELARVTTPPTGGGAATIDNTWRTFSCAPGGTLLVPTAARLPASGNATWQTARALDTGLEYRWTGTAWNPIRQHGSSALNMSGGLGTATFPAAFTTTPSTVLLSLGDFNVDVIVQVYAVTATTFTARAATLGGSLYNGALRVNWIALP